MLDIKNLITKGEHSFFEAKKATGKLPDSLWESYSAFANTNGGVILLGISDIDSKLTVCGVSDASKKIKNIWDILNDRRKISSNILMEKHVYVQQVEGKDVIVIEVPRADRHEKPVYINDDLFNGTFRRNAEGDYHCSRQSVKSMLRDQSDLPTDGILIHELSWQDLDKESITRYRNHFSSLKPSHVWNNLDTIEFLKKVGAIRKNESDVFSPTLAGLVMFGTEDVIMQILPDYFLDYREKYDNNRWSDRVVSNLGEWSGNIFDFFFKIANRMTADIKRPFQMRNNIEREDDTPVHLAIREALANALIHADYYGRQGIVIEKMKNEIKISNPGICRPNISEVLEGGVSDPRNPTIFKMFAMLDIGERAGSGVFNILAIWNDNAWEAPSLHEKFDPERTIVVLPIEFEDKDDVIEGGKTGGKSGKTGGKTGGKSGKTGGKTGGKSGKTGGKTLSEIQLKIIHLFGENPKISYKEMAEILEINTSAIQKHIDKLKQAGILQREGGDFGGKWIILE